MFERIKVTRINPHVYLMDDAGESTGYLVVGEQKAAVIDTMNGYEDVCAVVRTITDLPLMVINTHGHGDHICGNVYFDEAYIHPSDIALADEFTSIPEFVEEAQKRGVKMPPFRSLYGGETIDLGGITLKTIHLPGHTDGGLLILDVEDRVLFTGDAINRHLWLQLDTCLPAGEAADALEKLLYLTKEADFILHGHAKGTDPISLMNDLLRGLREIEAGQTENDLPYKWFGGVDRQHPFAEGSVICYKA